MSAANVTSPPMPSPSSLPLDPRTFIGPIFIGNIINYLLMGTLIVQVYIFYINSVGDRPMIRLLVYGVFLLDIVQTLFGTHFAWYYAIANWDNSPALTSSTAWSEATLPIMCGLVAAIVQIFYAWRIWSLKNTLIMRGMAIFIVLIAIAQSTSAIVASSLFEPNRTQQNLLRLHPAFEFWLAGSFVADIFISGCMIWILYDVKTQTPWSHSETIINRLIINMIQTGSATVVCAGVDLALFVKLKDTNYHLTPAFILGKLYSNSLLVTLNARKGSTSTTPSIQTESYGMRVHVTRQTHRTVHHDRRVESWPGVKLSQMTAKEATIMENDTDVNTDDENGKPIQGLDFADSPSDNGRLGTGFV